MPDVGTDLVAIVRMNYSTTDHKLIMMQLDEEFRYLQRKKNVIVELAEARLRVGLLSDLIVVIAELRPTFQNITFISVLTKFRIVPSHLILHMFKVCLDNFTGVNIDNIAMLLEGCGRFLLRNEETGPRFKAMVIYDSV